ncbi:Protein of unknown function [Pyronema omphalodes CBS 100304]|uniref:Uncharacterized protein n=1 Tax=Pyronema omphalodes (strain CBS 100304) TaxID=1076935 RepID=U4L444_PYROM|nr:Protein of unknown function [Pyronema omphalodes CBS 100304]
MFRPSPGYAVAQHALQLLSCALPHSQLGGKDTSCHLDFRHGTSHHTNNSCFLNLRLKMYNFNITC